MTTHRVSIPAASSGRTAARALSTSWSSGFRFSGLLSVSRATASAGRSRRSFPEASSSGPGTRLLEHDQNVALLHGLALPAADLLDDAVGLDLRHWRGRISRPAGCPAGSMPELLVIVAARNEADRIGSTLDALATAFPGAPLWVGDDASEDGTAEVAIVHGARVVRRGSSHDKGGNVTAAAEAALSDVAEA